VAERRCVTNLLHKMVERKRQHLYFMNGGGVLFARVPFMGAFMGGVGLGIFRQNTCDQ
jgi:hypothetical protein